MTVQCAMRRHVRTVRSYVVLALADVLGDEQATADPPVAVV